MAKGGLHHRQVEYSVKAPPTRGPITSPMFASPIKIPMIIGRFAKGTVFPMMVSAPL